MYKNATKQKLRYPTKRGQLSVEDLWDLPLTELDSLYATLSDEQEKSQRVSLLSKPTAKSAIDTLRIEILKDIVTTRLADAADKQNKAIKAQERIRILEAIERKKDNAFEEQSLEELQAALENLN